MKKVAWPVLVCIVAMLVIGCAKRTGNVSSNSSGYVGRWADYQNLIILKEDHTGTADGGVYSGGAKFDWQENGDHIVFSNWQGNSPDKTGKLSPSGESIHIKGDGGYLDLMRQK
jgi:hypothetical protein